jgi:hypothetical protein
MTASESVLCTHAEEILARLSPTAGDSGGRPCGQLCSMHVHIVSVLEFLERRASYAIDLTNAWDGDRIWWDTIHRGR